jgi:hypothetical protein
MRLATGEEKRGCMMVMIAINKEATGYEIPSNNAYGFCRTERC